jgi:hypothetical protein
MLKKLLSLFWRKDREPDPEIEPPKNQPAPVAPAAEGSEPRAHHYLFVHRLMHEWFFEEPEGFLGTLMGPAGTRQLVEAWMGVGAKLAEQGEQALSPQGLHVTTSVVAGRPSALVQLPPAKVAPEAWFVVLVAAEENGDAARYFVLERTDDVVPADARGEVAVLCEWLPGAARRNHGRLIPPIADAVMDAVKQELEEEAERRKAGVRPVLATTWNVAEGEDPSSALLDDTAARYLHCFFAFHLLPDAAFATGGTWKAIQSLAQAREQVAAVWLLSAQVAARAQDVGRAAAGPSCTLEEVGGQPHILIEMPQPLSPPEPFFLAAPVSGDTVYLAEKFGRSERPLFTSISQDGQHAVMGLLPDSSRETFLAAVAAARGGQSVPGEESVDLMGHMVHYAHIWNALRSVMDKGPQA